MKQNASCVDVSTKLLNGTGVQRRAREEAAPKAETSPGWDSVRTRRHRIDQDRAHALARTLRQRQPADHELLPSEHLCLEPVGVPDWPVLRSQPLRILADLAVVALGEFGGEVTCDGRNRPSGPVDVAEAGGRSFGDGKAARGDSDVAPDQPGDGTCPSPVRAGSQAGAAPVDRCRKDAGANGRGRERSV